MSGKRALRRAGSFIENKGNPLSTEPDEEEESGPVQVKLQNLKDATPISDAQLDAILEQLLAIEDNEERLAILGDAKDPYLFKSSNLIRLVDITPSLKTKMRMLYIIGPRLVDPRAEADYFKKMFRFSEEKSEVEEILKARVHTISTAQFNKSMGPGLLATGGRGPGGAGRGGRGAGALTGGRGGRGGATGRGGRGPASASQSANRSNPDLKNEVRAAETASMKHRRVKSHTDSLEGVATAATTDNSRTGGSDSDEEGENEGNMRRGFGASESNNSSLNSIVEVGETEEDVSDAVDGTAELKPRGMSRKSSSVKYASIKHAATMDEIKEAVENGSDSDYNSDIEKDERDSSQNHSHSHSHSRGEIKISTAKEEKQGTHAHEQHQQQSATGKLFGTVGAAGDGKTPLNPGATQPSPGSITTALSSSASGSPPGEEDNSSVLKVNNPKSSSSLSSIEISSSTPENDVSIPHSSSSCASNDSPDMKGLSPLLPPLSRSGGSPRPTPTSGNGSVSVSGGAGPRGSSPRPVGPSAPGSRQVGPKPPGFRQAGPTPPGSRGSSRPNSRPASRATSPFPTTDSSGLMLNPSAKVEEKVEIDKKPGEFSNFSRVGAGSEFKKLMQTFNKAGGDNKPGAPAPVVIKPTSSPAKKWGTVGIASKPIPTPVNTAAAIENAPRPPRGSEKSESISNDGPLSPSNLTAKSEDDQKDGCVIQRKNSRMELAGTVNLKERAAAFSGQHKVDRTSSHDDGAYLSGSIPAASGVTSSKTRQQSIAELMNGSSVNVKDRIACIARTNSFKLDGEENNRSHGGPGQHNTAESQMAFSPGSEEHPTMDADSNGLNSLSGDGAGEVERSRRMRRHSSAAGTSAVLARFNEALRRGEFSKVNSPRNSTKPAVPVVPAAGATGVDLAAQCAAILGIDRASFLELSPEGPLDANPPEEGPEGAVQYYTYKELVRRNYTKVYIDLKQTELEKYLLESEYESAFKISKDKFILLPRWKQVEYKKKAMLF